MKTVRVQIDFSRMRDADLEIVGAAVAARMNANVAFAELAPDAALVQTAHIAYAQALAAAHKGSPLDKAVKDGRKGDLVKALHDLGVKINLKAAGNQELLEPTGYPLVGGRTATRQAGPLEKIGQLEFGVKRGTGSIRVSFDPVAGAVAYKYQITAAPATAGSVWTSTEVSDNEFLFTGLTIRQEYAFRVAGIGKSPERVWSDIMTSYAI